MSGCILCHGIGVYRIVATESDIRARIFSHFRKWGDMVPKSEGSLTFVKKCQCRESKEGGNK